MSTRAVWFTDSSTGPRKYCLKPVTLADTCCGYGTVRALPAGAAGFTTIELKSNFLATAKAGDTVGCVARLVHGGRQTQVWDAEVVNRSRGKTMALFRCTQMMLYPR